MTQGKAKILEAARIVIVKQGIQGATIRAIAEEAGVSTGAIYHYYTSKEAILYDVMDEGLSEIKRIASMQHKPGDKKEIITQEIYDGMQDRFAKDSENRLQFYLAHEAMLGNEDLKAKFKDKYQGWVDMIDEIFAQAYGTDKSPLSKAVAAWTMAAIDGMTMQILLDTETADLDDINIVLDFLLKRGFPEALKLSR